MKENKASNPPPSIVKGSLFAVFAFFSMAVFGILTNEGYKTGDALWLSYITYLVAATGTFFLILPRGLISSLRSEHYSYLIARAVIGTAASFLYMLSMHYIPIVNSTLLFNTAPIFIPILSIFWLRKIIPINVWCAVVIGFIGILVIIKPGADILTDPGNLIGLASGIALAIAYLLIKILTKTDTSLRIIFYYFFIGMLIQAPFLFFTQALPIAHTYLYGCLSGIVLLIAQIALVKAYTYAEASEVGVYQYSSIVFVAIIEWLIAGAVPDFLSVIGFILVSIAGIIIIRAK